MARGQGPSPASAPRPPGPPRLYEPAAERRRILAATLAVLRRSDDREATITEILEESGLSTRAFYRHFRSKEDVIRALYRNDAESFGTHLRRRVDSAGGPEDGLKVWVNEVIGLGFDKTRAERVAVLSSPAVERILAGSEEPRLGRVLLVAPLRNVLDRGLAEGQFPAARPDIDVLTIGAMVWEAVAWARTDSVVLSRPQAVDQILRFTLPALRGD